MSIYTLGIDIGSTASKCIMLADGKDSVAKSLIPGCLLYTSRCV